MTAQYIIKNKEGTFYFKNKEMTINHREDGPAVEYTDGSKYWWLNGKRVSESEHKKLSTKEPTTPLKEKHLQ